MSKLVDQFAVINGVIAADVANNGAFTVSYPSGDNQQDYDTGLAPGTCAIILNGSDKYTSASTQVSFSAGSSNITVTNTSGVTWPAGTAFSLIIDKVDGNNVVYVGIPVNLASIAAGALLNPGLRPGVDGTIEYMEVYVQTPATTAAKAATINPTIDGVDVTGGTAALTSANMTPAGVSVAAAAITGANTISRHSKLGLKAASVTAFVEGVAKVFIRIRTKQSNLI
jgi:hypothetical protein